MKVAISGSSGLVGQTLMHALTRRGDQVTALHRGQDWHWDCNNDASHDWTKEASFEGQDAVIHLAGEKISEGRWTDAKKALIRDSRVRGTAIIAQTIAKLPQAQRPKVLICASAIGYYGSRGDERLTEKSSHGQGFLAETCKAWEEAADVAQQAGVRVVFARLGLVLAKEGGALAKMLPVFKLGGGGVLGDGEQYWSWIAIEDVAGIFEFLLDRHSVAGPVNLVGPQPVTNQRFTQTLGRVLQRPTFIPVPVFALRMAMGDMVDELLLSSARVEPAVLEDAGYEFAHPQLDEALRHLLK